MTFQGYWDKHPGQREVIQILREGQWVSHIFEWVFMMISRFTGYAMTLAIGYLIFYAIEFKHSLDVTITHPAFTDTLASFSNVVINVGPELVFPGVVVLCIRAFQRRTWLDGWLYLVTTVAFVILTMVLLNAFMNDGITKDFLSAMLFWRAGASLFYTVVAAYCGGHDGLDFRGLLNELDTLRGQLDGGQQQVSTLEQQLNTVQQQASTLRQQLDGAKQEVSGLQKNLSTEQQRASTLERELETGHGDTAGLRRELNTAKLEAETLLTRLNAKQREVEEMQVDQAGVVTLRRELNTAKLDAETLRGQLAAKQREIEGVQAVLSSEQHTVSSLRRELSSVQQQRVSIGQSVQVPTGQGKAVDAVDGGHRKVVQLDTNRPRKTGQDEHVLEDQIRALLKGEPDLSGRAIAAKLGCSPTTAAKWKALIEKENEQKGAVNE